MCKRFDLLCSLHENCRVIAVQLFFGYEYAMATIQ